MIRAIIFDMDGVIIDSEKLKAEAWKKIFSEYQIDDGDKWYIPRIGNSRQFLCEEAIRLFSLPVKIETLSKRKEEIYLNMLEEKTEPIKETIKFIQSIPRNFKLGVGSSTGKKIIEKQLALINILDNFDLIVSGEDDVKNNKPAPDIYNLIASKMMIEPFDCVVIEDSFSGVQAAKAAGMKCIAYKTRYTQNQDFLKADLIISNFSELTMEKLQQL